MPRPPTHTPERIVARALPRFWWSGYSQTSMDDLVRATGASRHAIYQAFGGKRELFIACLGRYRETVVTPAFSQVLRASAGGRAHSPRAQDDLAKLMASSVQGLWSLSRTVCDARVLRRLAASLVELVQQRIRTV